MFNEMSYYLAVDSTAANITNGMTKNKNTNLMRPISITANINASNPSTGVSQNFIKFRTIRFNFLFYIQFKAKDKCDY